MTLKSLNWMDSQWRLKGLAYDWECPKVSDLVGTKIANSTKLEANEAKRKYGCEDMKKSNSTELKINFFMKVCIVEN